MANSNSSSGKPEDTDAMKSVKALGLRPTRDIEKAAEFLSPPPARVLWFFRPFTESAERQKLMEVRRDFLIKAMADDMERTKEENRHEEAMTGLEIQKEKAKNFKGYICHMDGCGASFDDDKQLMCHFQQFHSGIKCRVGNCGASFDDDEKLTKHFQQCHSGVLIPCPDGTCQTFFVDVKALFKHVAQVHQGNVKWD